MTSRDRSPGKYIIRYSELFTAAREKYQARYPRLNDAISNAELEISRMPDFSGMPCPARPSQHFYVKTTPVLRDLPKFRILYQVGLMEVMMWSLSSAEKEDN